MPLLGDVVSYGATRREEGLQTDRFGLWLRKRREAAGLTQDQLAERAGIGKQYLSKIENAKPHSTTGRAPAPTLETLDAIARALRVDLSDVLGALGLQTGARDVALPNEEELLLWMFRDLPRECQLDVMASVSGVHQRRSLSASTTDRAAARATVRQQLKDARSALDGPIPGLRSNAREVPKPVEIDISDLEAQAIRKPYRLQGGKKQTKAGRRRVG